MLSAYDARTGKRHYQERLSRDSGNFSASPVAASGRVYFASEDGDDVRRAAGSRFELLARNDMQEMLLATPAVIGDQLLIRTRTHLVAIASKAQRAAVPASRGVRPP